MNITIANVKIKVAEDLKRLAQIRRKILTLNPIEDIANFALKRIEHYSPDSIKGDWQVEIVGDVIKFIHKRLAEKILWFLELGTIAHYVRPVNKTVLHWTEGGQDFFSAGHMVSGIKPHLFFTRTKSDVENYAKQKYGKAIKVVL